ncbi:inositol monophosphatase [Halobacteriales archaeon QH_7_66_37]|nr:MAG: inositol monophosphatase [Halobacteriales archaeon QH_7_66_37]
MSEATLRAAMAERAARAGGVVARETFRGDVAVETKANKNDLVTEADRDAQRQVIATIRQEFPNADFVCEEDSRPLGTDTTSVDLLDAVPETGDAWIVDPVDGTGNYVRGIRFWATSIATVSAGEAVAAATFLPAEGDIYTAGPESVSRNDESMTVSERGDPETFAAALIGWWAGLALVASGGLEVAFMPKTPHPWDAIAGVYLVRRAGGTVTDVHGNPWSNGDDGLVASNGEAHDAVLDAVRDGLDLD